MIGVRCWRAISIFLFLFLLVSTAQAAEQHELTTGRVSSQPTSGTRPPFQAADEPAPDPSIPESIRTLAENVAKNRKRLIEDLKRATTPEAKEDAAKALRKALGGDPEGKTLAPKELSDFVENLKKAESAADKEAAAKALADRLSPDGKGKELTPTVLHEAVKALKGAGASEDRETKAKELMRTLGPDGIQVFNKNGTIDAEAMAVALTLDKTKETDAFNSLSKALREPLEVVGVPLQGGNPEVPPGSVADAGGTPAVDPAEGLGPNVDLGSANGNDGLDNGVAGLNDEQVATEDLNEDLLDRLADAEDALEREQDRNRNNNKRGAGAGKQNDDNQDSGSGSGSGGGSGAGGGGGTPPQPMPLKDPPKLEPFAAFQAPAPAGNEPNLLEAIAKAGQIGDGDKKWDPTQSILNDVAMNGAKQIELAKMKSLAQEAMIGLGIDPSARGRNALSVTRTGGGPGDNSIAGRRSGMTPPRTSGKPRTYRNRSGASGPVLASAGRVPTQPGSFRTFAKVGSVKAVSAKKSGKRRSFKPRGRPVR